MTASPCPSCKRIAFIQKRSGMIKAKYIPEVPKWIVSCNNIDCDFILATEGETREEAVSVWNVLTDEHKE